MPSWRFQALLVAGVGELEAAVSWWPCMDMREAPSSQAAAAPPDPDRRPHIRHPHLRQQQSRHASQQSQLIR
jgi:hypothetical protein